MTLAVGGTLNAKLNHSIQQLLIRFQPKLAGCVAQSVTCLATDASLTTDPGVMSLIPAWSHTFVD